ncbi:hypothetical protein GCM10010441_61650 [Kitasatospora paracochleata]
MPSGGDTRPVRTSSPPAGPYGPDPVPDPRSCDLAPDFAGMEELVGGLVLPAHAAAEVVSALETARELVRHSYYRFEFATVAVAHAQLALERALALRLGAAGTVRELIDRAVGEGLLPADPAARLEPGCRVAGLLTRGEVTSAAVLPLRAVALVGAVFEAVGLLLPAPPDAGADSDESLARRWEEHCRAPYPSSFRGVDVAGVELILLDADLAAVTLCELRGELDDDRIAVLWRCIDALDRAVPAIPEAYCAAYFARWRTTAWLIARRYVPAAI